MSNRKRGAIATVLDQEALVNHANSRLDSEGALKFSAGFGRQMLLDTEDGPAVINTEGVGQLASEGTIAVFLTYGMTLTPVHLPLAAIEAAKTSEKIDIADGIRVFGDRLEVNHHIWYSRSTHRTSAKATS